MKTNFLTIMLAAVLGMATQVRAADGSLGVLPRLSASADGHFLQCADGSPFFYLGDTAWELFHRLTR